MHVLTFIYAACLLALGVLGLLNVSEPAEVRSLGIPGLFFGGAVLFCAFFAFKEPRHGMAGASFLGFLAFLTSAGRLFGQLRTLDLSTVSHRLTLALCLVSLGYILAAFFTWKRRRRARAIAELQNPGE